MLPVQTVSDVLGPNCKHCFRAKGVSDVSGPMCQLCDPSGPPSSAPLRSRLCVECVLTNEHAPDTEARP